MNFHKPSPIPALTGLRFVAAFLVLVAHSADWLRVLDSSAHFVTWFSFGPAIGMPLFFVLSGFVIHYNYGASFSNEFGRPTFNFFIARFSRLYPLYLFCLIIDLSYNFKWDTIVGSDEAFYLPYVPRYLLLWQAWSVQYYGHTWIGHLFLPMAWSISVEVFFYALYPCIALFILRIPTVRRAAIVLAAIVVGFYALIAFCYLNFDALRLWGNNTFSINADPQNALLGWLLNTGPVGRLWEFLMGSIVAQAIMRLRDTPLARTEIMVGSRALFGIIFLIAVFYYGAHRNAFLNFAGAYPGGFAPLCAGLIFCCARYKNAVTVALSSSGMVTLGDASYSIYLLHAFTLRIFIPPNPIYSLSAVGIVVWVLTMSVAIVFTLMAAIGSYRILEVPARGASRRILPLLFDWIPMYSFGVFGKPIVRVIVATFIVGTCVAWNWPRPFGPIEIIEASYGGNCKTTSSAVVNTFRPGNATLEVNKICRGSRVCNFAIDVNRFGDTMAGCAKDFKSVYRCPNSSLVQTAYIPGEANHKRAVLDCGDDLAQPKP